MFTDLESFRATHDQGSTITQACSNPPCRCGRFNLAGAEERNPGTRTYSSRISSIFQNHPFLMEANRLASNTVGFFNFVAVCSIVIYQKAISPVKGFSCAHRYRHGGLSCSEYVKQVVFRKGIVSGYTDIRSRFHACKSAALEIHGKSPQTPCAIAPPDPG